MPTTLCLKKYRSLLNCFHDNLFDPKPILTIGGAYLVAEMLAKDFAAEKYVRSYVMLSSAAGYKCYQNRFRIK